MAKKKSMEELLDEAIVKDIPYEVPENWSFIKFNNILSTEVNSLKRGPFGSAIKKDYFVPSGYKVYEQKNAIYNDMSLGNYYVNEEKYKELEAFAVNPGDIIVSCSGTVGKIALVPEESEKGIINQALLKISLNEEIINKKFFLNLFVSEPFNSKIIDDSRGSAIKNIAGTKILKEVAVPIPPMKEQERIVERIESLFEKLDNSLELIQEARDGFETRKAAVLEKAFMGEITKGWRLNNNISLDLWCEKKLDETTINIIDGDRGNNYPKKDEFLEDGYCLFLNAKNVTKDGFKFDEMNFITKEKDEVLRKGKLLREDIVLTTRGTIGNIAHYDYNIPYENVRINSGMVIYRGGEEFYKPFLCWLYKSTYITNQINNIKTGTAQPQLPIKIMRDLKLIIPPLEEQKEIVRILDKLLEDEDKIKELTQLEEQIELIKKSILAKAFRGELGTNRPEEDSAVEVLKSILR